MNKHGEGPARVYFQSLLFATLFLLNGGIPVAEDNCTYSFYPDINKALNMAYLERCRYY